jgi:tetratricopeptide (TPR) repeat protein
MKKNLLKTMLVALLFTVGSTAWAGEKIVANYSFDNENNPVLTIGNRSGATYDYESVATLTNFLTLYDKDNNHNGDTYVNFTADTDLSAEEWTLDFYWAANSGSNNRPGYTYFYAGETKLFTITDPGVNKTSKLALTYGESGNVELTVPIMNTSNRFKASIATVLNKKNYWYHFTITGSPTNGVLMTVADCNGSAALATNAVLSATNVAPTAISLRPAACGALAIDQLKLTYATDEAVANTPTVELTGVDGVNRLYTIAISENETLHYTLPGSSEEQTSTNAETVVTATADGDLIAWTTNGSAISEKVVTAVSTGAVTLAVPTYALTEIGDGYEKGYKVTCDNSGVLLKPTATLTYTFEPLGYGQLVENEPFDGMLHAFVAGTYTITASAEGYTSSQLVIKNDKRLVLVKEVDVLTLDPTTVSSNWVKYADKQTVGSSSQWARYFTEPMDGYWYNYTSETASATDILEGLSIEVTSGGKTPQLFAGLGLMYPVYMLDANGASQSTAITTGQIGIANPEGKYAVITYRPGYSSNNYSTVLLEGNQTWAMNRFDKAITKYQIYEEKSPVYIETDLTSQFTALTNPDNWVNAIGANTMAYATWAAPQVTVNGNKVPLVESYGEGQEFKLKTGDVMYQTITGLTPGTYAVELYGSANLTPGRAGMTTDFEEGDDNALNGAYLYAQSGEQTVKSFVPCLIEDNMNNRGGEEAIPTAKLEGIQVGDDGKMKIGLYKNLGLTNWHFVQLKSVIAQVDAVFYYGDLVAQASDLSIEPMNADVLAALEQAMVDDSAFKTTDEYLQAIANLTKAIDDAKLSIDDYANTKATIDEMAVIAATLDENGQQKFSELVATLGYDDRSMDVDESLLVKQMLAQAVKAQRTEGSDFTFAAPTVILGSWWNGQTGTYTRNGVVRPESWKGNLYTGDVLTQTIEGLPNGKYEIVLEAAASIAWITGDPGDDRTVLFANNTEQNIPVIDQTGRDDFGPFTISGIVTDGKLTFGMKNIAEGGNWFVIDLKSITFTSAITISDDLAEALEELNQEIGKAIDAFAEPESAPKEAEEALLNVIDEADALYKKGGEATVAEIADMIQRLRDAVADFKQAVADYNPTTAIRGITAADGKTSIYTVSGQRATTLRKGIYVLNGRKVVVK